MDQIFEISRYEKETKPNKNWGFPSKFKLFNILSWTHEIFKVTEYKKR